MGDDLVMKKARKWRWLGVVWTIMGLLILGATGAPEGSKIFSDNWTVCPEGPPACPYSKIQEAIDAASDWDTITIAPGTYVENLTIHNKSLRVMGTGRKGAYKMAEVYIRPADPSQYTISIVGDFPIQVRLEGFSVVGPNTQPQLPLEGRDEETGIMVAGHALVIAQDLEVAGYSYAGFYGFFAEYLALQDTKISRNRYGIKFYGSRLVILNSQVLDNIVGLRIVSSLLTMEGSVLLRNGLGAHLIGQDTIIDSNWVELNNVVFLLEGTSTDRVYEVLIRDNQIYGNRYYGIVLSDPTCSWEEMKLEKSGPIKVRGTRNEMYFNGQDLCPADYSWPPGFKKP